jgi:hypothetical protein
LMDPSSVMVGSTPANARFLFFFLVSSFQFNHFHLQQEE